MRTVLAAAGITGAVVSLAFALTPPSAPAQRDTHARLFPPEQLGLLEAAGRDEWQEPQRVMDSLGIADGARVADIGAGGGWFTIRLAHRVGPNGVVYAEDIQPEMIESIRRRVVARRTDQRGTEARHGRGSAATGGAERRADGGHLSADSGADRSPATNRGRRLRRTAGSGLSTSSSMAPEVRDRTSRIASARK